MPSALRNFSWILAWAILSNCGWCQTWEDEGDLNLVQVFVPADQLSQVLKDQVPGTNYIFVAIVELQELLDARREQSRANAIQVPHLQSARYLCQLENGLLQSELSQWVFSGNAQSYNVGEVSFALRPPPQSVPSSPLYFTAGGNVEIQPSGDSAEQEYWFGFSAAPSRNDSKQYNLEVPVATDAQMLVAAPSTAQLSSDEVVVQRIDEEELAKYVPNSWPNRPNRPGELNVNGNLQWWLIHLSGVSRFSLRVSSSQEISQQRYQSLLLQNQTVFTLRNDAIEVRARFELPDAPEDPLLLEFTPGLQITTITANGIKLDVDASTTPQVDRQRLKIGSELETNSTLEVTGTMPRSAEATFELPQVNIANSFALQGETWIQSERQQATYWLESTGQRTAGNAANLDVNLVRGRSPLMNPSDPSPDLQSDLSWTIRWLGETPKVRLHTSRPSDAWQIESLHQLSANEEWLVTQAQVRLSAEQVRSNLLDLDLGKGWLIDRVRVLDFDQSDESDVTEASGSTESAARTRVASWNSESGKLQLLLTEQSNVVVDLEISAHRRLERKAGHITLFGPESSSGFPMVSVPGSTQLDTYVVESSEQHRLLFLSDLLNYQHQASDLPLWQQRRLSSTAQLILQSSGGELPELSFVPAYPTFSAQITGLSTSEQNVCLVRIQPLSGNVNAIRMSFPEGSTAKQWDWDLLEPDFQADDTRTIALKPIAFQGQEKSGLEFKLPDPRGSPFLLRGTNRSVRSQGGEGGAKPQALEFPLVHDAITVEGTFVAEVTNISPSIDADIELLPAASCCEDPLLARLFVNEEPPSASSVAGRFEVEKPLRIDIAPTTSQGLGGWIWSERIEHWQEGSARNMHQANWAVQVGDAPNLRVHLPRNWQVVEVAVDRESTSAFFVSDGILTLPLPPRKASLVTATFSSSISNRHLMIWESDNKPLPDIPVVQSSVAVHIPPSQTAIQSMSADSDVSDRFRPQAWWRWLSPADSLDTTSSSRLESWQEFEFDSGRTNLFVADRGMVATCVWLCLSLSIALAWSFIGFRFRRGWLALGLACVLLALVPPAYVAFAQLLVLSLVLAALLRMCQSAVRPQARAVPKEPSHRSPRSQRSTAALTLLFIFCGLEAQAQLRNDVLSTSGAADDSEVFGILIPVKDPDSTPLEVDGSYVYIRERLYNLLQTEIGAPFVGTVPTRLLTADYLLRLSSTDQRLGTTLQEFSAEFRVAVGSVESELRLPFLAEELSIRRIEIDGKLRTDQTVIQDDDAIVFRPGMPGAYTLKLYFQPIVETEEGDRERLQVQIPIVPVSNLRVVGAPASTIKVAAAGGRDLLGNDVQIALGPVDEIDCSWLATDFADEADQTARSKPHLWLHGQRDSVAAVSALEVNSANGLPQRFHVLLDESWEPVSEQWGDAKLLLTENAALTRRKIYELELTESAKAKASAGQSVYIQVALAPRESPTGKIPLPFLLLQEATQASERNLTWTDSGDSRWTPEGLNVWPLVSPALQLDWDELPFKTQFEVSGQERTFRLPSGFLTSGLTRDSRENQSTLVESTRIEIGLLETSLRYTATLQNQSEDSRPDHLRFLIPSDVKVRSVTLNNRPWDYRIVQQGSQTSLLTFPQDQEELRTDLNGLEGALRVVIHAVLPTRTGKSPLQRIVMQGKSAESSQIYLYRESQIGMNLEADPELEAYLLEDSERIEDSPSSLYQNVSSWDFGNDLRDSSGLAVSFEIQSRDATPGIHPVLYVEQIDNIWQASLKANWDAENGSRDPLVFVDIPAELGDTLVTNHDFETLPIGNSNRVVIAISPTQNPLTSSRELSVSFPIDSSNLTQSIALPDIRVLPPLAERTTLALTKSLNGQAIRWSTNARKTTPSPSTNVHQQGDFEYFEQAPNRPAFLRWQVEAPIRQSPTVRVAHIVLKEADLEPGADYTRQVTGWVHYWIDPRGHTEIQVETPASATLIGCLLGDQPANTRSESAQQTTVLLQPNYLPCHLRLLVQWGPLDDNLCELPKLWSRPASDSPPMQLIPEVQWLEPGRLSVSLKSPRTGESLQRAPPFLAPIAWVEMVESSLDALKPLEILETRAWLRSWHPAAMGYETEASLEVPAAAQARFPNALTIQDFWVEACLELGVSPQTVEPSEATQLETKVPSVTSLGNSALLFYESKDTAFLIQGLGKNSDWSANLLVAGGVALLCLIIVVFAAFSREKYFALMADYPFLYWAQLAACFWIFLPIYWPACVMALTSVLMLIGQLWDSRRAASYR